MRRQTILEPSGGDEFDHTAIPFDMARFVSRLSACDAAIFGGLGL